MNDQRPVVIIIFIFLVGLVLLTKLFLIQVVDDSFIKKAERNAIQRVVDHPYRGLVYDRTGKLLVYNNPIFDLMLVPKEFQVGDTTCHFSPRCSVSRNSPRSTAVYAPTCPCHRRHG